MKLPKQAPAIDRSTRQNDKAKPAVTKAVVAQGCCLSGPLGICIVSAPFCP
jgi:hypothetical protein